VKRPWVILTAVALSLGAAPFLRLGDTRVVGFRYSVFINNAATICPDQVVWQDGTTIGLSDGRRFVLDHIDSATLAGELHRAEYQVFIDPADGMVYALFRRSYCGFSRPERSQIVTIPLVRKDLPSHGRHAIASARPAEPSANN